VVQRARRLWFERVAAGAGSGQYVGVNTLVLIFAFQADNITGKFLRAAHRHSYFDPGLFQLPGYGLMKLFEFLCRCARR
jgi:hypothetical protein